MNSKISKATPLLLLLMICLGPLTIAPTSATSYSTPSTYTSSSKAPGAPAWLTDSSKYASYNGHFGSHEWDYPYHPYGNTTSAILVANLTNVYDGSTYSNLTIRMYEFFTEKNIPGVSGLWYKLNTANGKIADSITHNSALNGYPCFFALPDATTYHINDLVQISSPFNETSLTFKVNKTETVLGKQTIQLVHDSHYTDYSLTRDIHAQMWYSNDSNGLLMRLIGNSYYYWSGSGYSGSFTMTISMQVFKTNILTLVLPPMPTTQAVPWMKAGKFIQFNLQGPGYIDPSWTNQTSHMTFELPGDLGFRMTVSTNVTLVVQRATTGYVPEWRETRWIWVVHVMLNNTKIFLPDFVKAVNYLNDTTGLPTEGLVPGEVYQFMDELSHFNHTGLVAEGYFIVDNGTGLILASGMDTPAYPPAAFDPNGDIGIQLGQGYVFLVLQYIAQSYLNPTWSLSNKTAIHMPLARMDKYTKSSQDLSVNASVAVQGTRYITFPEGGGGNCWHIASSVNSSMSVTMLYNKTGGSGQPDHPVANVSVVGTSSGYLDIERFSGFPLDFKQHISVTSTGNFFYNFTPSPASGQRIIIALNWTVGFGLDLTATVPRSSIMWVSYPTETLVLGGGGNATLGYNSTMPPGSFNQYGFHITMTNVTDVEITGSATPPPDTGNPPTGSTAFIYLSITGKFMPGTDVVELYVFVNRSRVNSLHIDEYSLRLYSWNSSTSQWEELKDPQGHPASYYVYINTTHGCIVGHLYHLSYFAVLSVPSTTGGGLGGSTTMILIAAVAVVLIAAAVVVLRRRKH